VRAQTRVALVIGNGAYEHTSKLDNPRNDATDMAAVLRKLGFQVIDGFDLDKPAFERKVRDFSVALRNAEVGVFFYAGHGLQVAGQNYLVPTDAKAETADALDWEMVRLDLVHRTMERATSTNIIFLDACRNNPLARNLARAMGTRSAEIGRGLAAVESGVGTLISFSTQPGNVALDGSGRNSPFAASLVKRIASSGDDLSALLIDVRNDVRKETQNVQVPWEHSALTGRFYFNQAKGTPASTTSRQSEAAEAWSATERSTSIAVLEAFIARFKDTFYAELARARIEDLKKQQIAVASPAPSSPTSKGAPSKPGQLPPHAYPDRPIKLLVGSAPGGPSDFVARQLSASMEKDLGQRIEVENVPGGSGAAAADRFARAANDGYTLLLWVSSTSGLRSVGNTAVATVAVQGDVVYGLVAPAGTSDSVVSRVNAAVNKALSSSPDLKSGLAKIGAAPRASTPREASVLIGTGK
jgi:uncharacterized caspase-like protein